MDPEERQFLTLTTIPAILSQQQAGYYLGVKWHNIPRLVESGVLSPLGHPKPNSLKFFALMDLERLRSDPKKLSRAIDSIQGGSKRKKLGPAGHASFRSRNNSGDNVESFDENERRENGSGTAN